jgi:outer membrane protein TolC
MRNIAQTASAFLCTVVAVLFLPPVPANGETYVRRITLTEAQAHAAGRARDLGQLSIDAARYHRKAAQADYFPKIDSTFFNFHFNKLLGETIQLVRRDRELRLLDKDQTVLAFTLTQPVTPLLKVHQAVQIARADEAITQAKAVQLSGQVAANVERVYFELLIAQRRQTLAEAAMDTPETGFQLVSAAAAPMDNRVTNRAPSLEARKELEEARNHVNRLMLSLNTLIGFAPDTVLDPAAPDPVMESVSLAEATRQALAGNIEITEAEQSLVKARAATKLSKLEYIPDVAVIGGYVHQNAVPLLPNDFSFIGVMASYNVFDFGKRENTVNERKTQLAMAEINVELTKAKVAASVQQSFFDFERARRIRDLTRQLTAAHLSHPVSDPAEPGARAALARLERDMYEAELEYRMAFLQFQRTIDGE